MPVDLDKTDFLERIVVTQPIKKINLDPALYKLFEYVIKINIDNFAISKKTTM